MVLSLRQQLKLSQQLLMTPQLQMAIKLLQLSRLELADTLREEIEQNPLLEEITVDETDTGPPKEEVKPRESEKTGEISMESSAPMQEINWDDYDNHYDAGFSFSREAPDPNRATLLDFLTKKPNLQTHLQWQLSHSELVEEEEQAGLFVIGNLDRHGFLKIDVEDIVTEIGCSPETAARVISIIQDMDPAGVAGRNVEESLLLQLRRLGLEDSLPATIVRDHLNSLQSRNYGAIAKACGRPIKDILAAIDVITRLDPYPCRALSDEEIHYIIPDVYIHKLGDEYVIVLNDEGLPRLQISSAYQEMLENESKTPAETKNYIKNKVKEASWLIKSIQQRQQTIYKVVESLLKFQRDFFEKGAEYLKPLVLRDVAEDIEMHESTVSRVTTNKYVHTPQGIYELKYFFSTALEKKGGDSVAAESIRFRIKDMIKTEDPDKPLTDNAISEFFAGENIKVARRTVAKYREQLGLLPVKLRRKPKM